MPIRLRLAALFTVAVLVLLTGGGLLYVTRLRDGLQASLDTTLRARAAALAAELAVPGATSSTAALHAIPNGYAQLLSPAGTVRRTTPGLAGALLTPAQAAVAARSPLVADVTSTLSSPTETGQEAVRVRAEPAPGGLVLAVGTARDVVDEAVSRATTELIVLGAVVLVLAGPGAWLLTSAALRPVERLRTQAAELQAHDAETGLAVPRTRDEIARLAVTLNGLLSRLHVALARERSFVADAGHELRTPLTVLKGELELAGRPGRDRDQLAATVQVAAEETERLIRLADDLLRLARHTDTAAVHGPLDLTELARASATAAGPLAAARGVVLTAVPDGPLPALGDPDRLRQALDNLLGNAIRYSPPGGVVTVTAAVNAGDAEIAVNDQGPGFPPAFLPVAFDRFTRADPARGRIADEGPATGTGLGLAIVAAIMTAHRGTATADNPPGGGARVRLRWPAGR